MSRKTPASSVAKLAVWYSGGATGYELSGSSTAACARRVWGSEWEDIVYDLIE